MGHISKRVGVQFASEVGPTRQHPFLCRIVRRKSYHESSRRILGRKHPGRTRIPPSTPRGMCAKEGVHAPHQTNLPHPFLPHRSHQQATHTPCGGGLGTNKHPVIVWRTGLGFFQSKTGAADTMQSSISVRSARGVVRAMTMETIQPNQPLLPPSLSSSSLFFCQ